MLVQFYIEGGGGLYHEEAMESVPRRGDVVFLRDPDFYFDVSKTVWVPYLNSIQIFLEAPGRQVP